jgi:rhodanese-related sulfurtransferase
MLRDRLAPEASDTVDTAGDAPSEPAKADAAPAPVQRPAPCEPEDVQLDAFHVLDKAGIGYDFIYVDVREPVERAATGIIEGAIAVPLGSLSQQLDRIPNGERIVCYCASGGRSTHAALTLRAAGYDDAWSLSGGIRAWSREGGELVSDGEMHT